MNQGGCIQFSWCQEDSRFWDHYRTQLKGTDYFISRDFNPTHFFIIRPQAYRRVSSQIELEEMEET